MGGGSVRGLDFTVEIDVAGPLAADDDRFDALITVKATGVGAGAPAARNAEILIMDRSRSMMGGNKMHEAQRAACAAIDALPDGALLGIVAGSRSAERVFPLAGELATVDAGTKMAAKRAVLNLRPAGGTEIGRWLAAAGELFATVTAGVICHAVLYSDGKNEHETRVALDAALRACADQFVCDVRGLGDDWDYTELLHIAEALHGDATAVLRIADLADDFTRIMQRVQRLVVPRAYLRLSPDPRFEIVSVEQTRPVHVRLTGQRHPAGGTAVDLPLGSWEEETRLYRVSLRFDPDTLPLGAPVRVTPVELHAETADGAHERRAEAPLVVQRHDLPGRKTERSESHTEMARITLLTVTIQACVDAWSGNRTADADDELDSAIRLARQIRDVRLPALERIADFADGRARLRPDVTAGEMKRLGLDSRKTGFRPEDEEIPPPVTGRKCSNCGKSTYVNDPRFCEACGDPFDEQDPV